MSSPIPATPGYKLRFTDIGFRLGMPSPTHTYSALHEAFLNLNIYTHSPAASLRPYNSSATISSRSAESFLGISIKQKPSKLVVYKSKIDVSQIDDGPLAACGVCVFQQHGRAKTQKRVGF